MELGLVQWFQFGDGDTVRSTVRELRDLGVTRLRTGLSWADYVRNGTESGVRWYDWVYAALAEAEIEPLPVLCYTPPSISRNERTNGAPERIEDFAAWVGEVVERYGRTWSHVEIWNEPNSWAYWDRGGDLGFLLLAQMLREGAEAAHARGVGTVFPAPHPNDLRFMAIMFAAGALAPGLWDALGMHAFPGTWENMDDPAKPFLWQGWDAEISQMQKFIPEVWLTEVGYTFHHRKGWQQADAFRAVLAAAERNNVRRVYWYSLYDLPRDVPSSASVLIGKQWHNDREYRMGMSAQLRGAIKGVTSGKPDTA